MEKKVFGLTLNFWLAIALIALCVAFGKKAEAQQNRMNTFPLGKPIVEQVVFCQEQKAVEHIVTVAERQGDEKAGRLLQLYGNAGECGQLYAAITYTERVSRIGSINIYKGKMGAFVIYVATSMSHDEI